MRAHEASIAVPRLSDVPKRQKLIAEDKNELQALAGAISKRRKTEKRSGGTSTSRWALNVLSGQQAALATVVLADLLAHGWTSK
jgi:hypothetical protein